MQVDIESAGLVPSADLELALDDPKVGRELRVVALEDILDKRSASFRRTKVSTASPSGLVSDSLSETTA